MDAKIHLLTLKNTVKLEKLIRENAPYDQILKESQLLDKYLFMEMKYINKIK